MKKATLRLLQSMLGTALTANLSAVAAPITLTLQGQAATASAPAFTNTLETLSRKGQYIYATHLAPHLHFQAGQPFSLTLPEGTFQFVWTEQYQEDGKSLQHIHAHSQQGASLHLYVNRNPDTSRTNETPISTVSGQIETRDFIYHITTETENRNGSDLRVKSPLNTATVQIITTFDKAATNPANESEPDTDVINRAPDDFDWQKVEQQPLPAYQSTIPAQGTPTDTPEKNARQIRRATNQANTPAWQTTIAKYNPSPKDRYPAPLLSEYPTINAVMPRMESRVMWGKALQSDEVAEVDLLVLYESNIEHPYLKNANTLDQVKFELTKQLMMAHEGFKRSGVKIKLRVVGLEPINYQAIKAVTGPMILEPLEDYLDNKNTDPVTRAKWDAEWANGGAEYFDKVMTAAVRFERCNVTAWLFKRSSMCPSEKELPLAMRPEWMAEWVDNRVRDMKTSRIKRHTQPLEQINRFSPAIAPEFERIKQLREKTGADVLVVVGSMDKYSYATTGTGGYSFPNWAGVYIPLPSIIYSSETKAPVADALMHELGHLFGLEHQARTSVGNVALGGFDYSTSARGPYVFGFEGEFDDGSPSKLTVGSFMSYGIGVRHLSGWVSSPDLFWGEYRMGGVGDLPANSILYRPVVRDKTQPVEYGGVPSNEARALNEARFTVSGFRPKKVAQEISLALPDRPSISLAGTVREKNNPWVDLLAESNRYQLQSERTTWGGVCRFPALGEGPAPIWFDWQWKALLDEVEAAKAQCLADLAAYKVKMEPQFKRETDSTKKQQIKENYRTVVTATENELWWFTFKFLGGGLYRTLSNHDYYGSSTYSTALAEGTIRPSKVYVPSTGVPFKIYSPAGVEMMSNWKITYTGSYKDAAYVNYLDAIENDFFRGMWRWYSIHECVSKVNGSISARKPGEFCA